MLSLALGAAAGPMNGGVAFRRAELAGLRAALRPGRWDLAQCFTQPRRFVLYIRIKEENAPGIPDAQVTYPG